MEKFFSSEEKKFGRIDSSTTLKNTPPLLNGRVLNEWTFGS